MPSQDTQRPTEGRRRTTRAARFNRRFTTIRNMARAITENDHQDSNPPRQLPYLNTNTSFIRDNSETSIDVFPLPAPPSPPPTLPRGNRLTRRPRLSFYDNLQSLSQTSWRLHNEAPTAIDSDPVSIIPNSRDSLIPEFHRHPSSPETLHSAINRASQRSLIDEMTSTSLESNSLNDQGLFQDHSAHTSSFDLSLNPIEQCLETFLQTRQICGHQYDRSKLLKRQKPNKSKKRSHAEMEYEEHTDYISNHHKFHTIRPQKSSFLKVGIKLTENIKRSYHLSFVDLNLETMTVDGYLQFNSNEEKVKWANEFIVNKHLDNTKKTSSIPFTGEIIDFEKNDLRYNTMLQQKFDLSMQDASDITLDFHSIYQNCIMRKQLSRWMTLKPFKNMSIKSMITSITCVNCLELLQSKFILLKLYVKASKMPDLLACVNRETGSIELVACESKNTTITEHMLHERDLYHYDKYDTVIEMTVNRSRYSSASVSIS